MSKALLEEYEGLLSRSRLRLDPRRITRSMRSLQKAATLLQLEKQLLVTSDPEDNKVLDCALEGGAKYLVTGNTRHFPKEYQRIRILAPRQFLAILAAHL